MRIRLRLASQDIQSVSRPGSQSGRVKYVTFVGAKSGEALGVKQQAQLEGWRLDGFTHPPLLLLAQPPNTSIGVHPIKAVSVQKSRRRILFFLDWVDSIRNQVDSCDVHLTCINL